MKKISTILLAVMFMFSAGASFAAGNALQNYQQKRNEAIKKHDAKIDAYQKNKKKPERNVKLIKKLSKRNKKKPRKNVKPTKKLFKNSNRKEKKLHNKDNNKGKKLFKI